MIRVNVAKAGALAAGVGFLSWVMNPENRGARCPEESGLRRINRHRQRKNIERGVWRCHIPKLPEAGPHTLFPNQGSDALAGAITGKLAL